MGWRNRGGVLYVVGSICILVIGGRSKNLSCPLFEYSRSLDSVAEENGGRV